MPNRERTQDPQQGRRNPMQTTPDDDEAQLEDQTPLGAQDEGAQQDLGQPQQGRRRRNPDLTEEQERVTQVEDEEAEDDEDEADGLGPRPEGRS